MFCANIYLKTVIIGDSIKTIGSSAFSYCMNLSTIHFGTGLERIDNCAFEECLITKVYIKDLISSFGFDIASEKVVDILLAYNLLIYKQENGNLIINYREDDLGSYNKEKLYICLHKCLYHYYRPIV